MSRSASAPLTFLLLPALAAILYTIGSLLLKRSLARGIGPWRTGFVCNLGLAAAAAPFLIGAPAPAAGAAWWQPVGAGAAFFVGQVFTFLAIDRGDISIATPILGTKVIFVALFTFLLIDRSLGWHLWLAAFLTAAALALLGGGNGTTVSQNKKKLYQTALYTSLAAFSFSFTDVAVQKWAPLWGGAAMAPRALGVCALLSLGLIPLFTHRLREVNRVTWLWLGGGALLMSIQAAILYGTLSTYGHATAVNVVYNIRGFLTVLLVWSIGHWFHNEERKAGPAEMTRRLAASLLILTAIGLVLK